MKANGFLAFLLELVFIVTSAGLLWIMVNIPFAKAGPFSLMIIGALGFSLICILQGYVHFIGKLELPLGNYVVSLFVRKHHPKAIQKIQAHSRSPNYRRR
jgi:hypothetical protein